MTIKEIKALPDKAMLISPGAVGKCTGVMPRKTGMGQYGEWSLQSFMLEDSTDKIRATAWNRPDIVGLQGKTVQVSAVSGDKGWGGCMIEQQSTKDGTAYKQIKIQSQGILEELRISPLPAPPANPVAEPTVPGTPPPSSEPSPYAPPTAIAFHDYVNAAFGAYHHLMLQADRAKVEMPPDIASVIVGGLMIAVRDGKIALPTELEPEGSRIPF